MPTARRVLAALVAAAALGTTAARAHEGHTTGPHPTATTATPGNATTAKSDAPAAPVPVAYRIRPEAEADLGWTGISHDQAWPADQRLAFALDCSAGTARCTALGGTSGDFFGAPVPLSAGGIPACIVNRLRSGVGGSVDPKSGCGDLQISLTSAVFMGDEVGRPCPVCRADPTPNDGQRGGHCEGGGSIGTACDAQGSSILGTTSNDCLPSAGKSAGELTIDLAPLTTGTASLQATLTCKAGGGKDAARCFCPAQVEPNGCIGGRCDTGSGHCPDGPLDGVCSKARYRGCRPGSGAEDCGTIHAGSGECEAIVRPCFGETITATGRCDPKTPTYVAVFCTPQTRAAAINASSGLPGPTRLVLPLERVP